MNAVISPNGRHAIPTPPNIVKRTDPTIVARATTYSGKVVRIVHVFSDVGLAVNAEHCIDSQRQEYVKC
jgi:hypothetical protein